ncbi:Hypothetical predicted protein [Pelobates cultripes]|uniref:Uncharacterized protein n=1 Tax=Pelobates cultripes TaxID=61616 RepID=A0AAD1WE35_PELCU|nr:Hypothetical predicted protein [Pelobates cultripes]
MAAATRIPSNTGERQDVLSRLDKIFEDFWQRVESRMQHPPFKQQGSCSTPRQIHTKQQPGAPAAHRPPTWRRTAKSSPIRRRKATKRVVPRPITETHQRTAVPGITPIWSQGTTCGRTQRLRGPPFLLKPQDNAIPLSGIG